MSVSVLFSDSVCLDDVKKGLGSRVATHSVYHMFSLYFDLLKVISHFVFEGESLVLIASVLG